MIHIYDYLFEPIKKIVFQLQSDKSKRWYSHTNQYVTPGINPNDFLFNKILENKPFMTSRLGTSEMHILLNFLQRERPIYENVVDYFRGILPEFWWGQYALNDLSVNSGFFPSNPKSLEKFSKLYLNEIKKIDVLLTWLRSESYLEASGFFENHRTNLFIFDCEPYFYENPWTLALKDKKVLVIHPFEKSIHYQYQKRHLLFAKKVLPHFELKTIKAVQSIKGNQTNFSDWFHALDFMKEQIDKCDFDIALIAAGSYGLPLAGYIKSKGKIGLHLGGFLQLIFGIKGKRWEKNSAHFSIMNEHWKSPYPEEYPINYEKLDHGSYW